MRSLHPKWWGRVLWDLVSTGACLAVLLACDGGGEAADIAFEVAVDVDSMECGLTAVERNPELESMPCATVRLFEQSDSGALTPVRLFNPDGDREGEGELERRVQLDETRRIQFDARIPRPEIDHTLVFRFYNGDGDPVFGATVVNRRFGPDQPRLRVRLYPFREFACAGTGLEAGLARALHEAISLPNGDVVIFGGVTGTGLSPTSVQDPARTPGATLERSVVLYDASEHAFVRLDGEAFGRVGFAAEYAGLDANQRHRIQVVGGYAPAAPSSPLVLFDNGARFAPSTVPFSFTEEPVLQDPVELRIDVEGRSVAIERLELSPVLVGGFAAISERPRPIVEGATSLVVPGLLPPLDGMDPNTPRRLNNTYFFLSTDSGMPNTPSASSAVGRIGATATELPNQNAWLVWGGGIGRGSEDPDEEPPPDIRDVAGELIAVDGVRQVLQAGSGIPEPTAFHSATRFPNEDTVVFVGGYELRVSRTVGVRPTMAPIVALRFTGTTVLPRVIAQCAFVPGPMPDSLVSECDYQNTAFHTVTVVPGVGMVIVGGATTADELSPMAARRFEPTEAVSVVNSALGLERLPERSNLTVARFGHTATLLPGNRLLVVGGFTEQDPDGDSNLLSAVVEPEVIYLDKAPPTVSGTQCTDTSDFPDAGVDAGVDAGEFTFDAGPDAGPDGGPDGGLPDGAVPDGGLPDGALLDGGPFVDSGVDGG